MALPDTLSCLAVQDSKRLNGSGREVSEPPAAAAALSQRLPLGIAFISGCPQQELRGGCSWVLLLCRVVLLGPAQLGVRKILPLASSFPASDPPPPVAAPCPSSKALECGVGRPVRLGTLPERLAVGMASPGLASGAGRARLLAGRGLWVPSLDSLLKRFLVEWSGELVPLVLGGLGVQLWVRRLQVFCVPGDENLPSCSAG